MSPSETDVGLIPWSEVAAFKTYSVALARWVPVPWCRRSAKIEQRFTLNFDQGWKAGGDPPAVDKCTAVAGADNGVVGVKAVRG